MSALLASHLRDFTSPARGAEGRKPAFGGPIDFARSAAPLAHDAPEPGPDIDILVEQAHRRGRNEAYGEAALLHAEEVAQLRAAHREEMAELRTQLEQELSTVIASRFDRLSQMLVDVIGTQVAEILAPCLSDSMAQTMIDALAEEITKGLRDNAVAEITVSGPMGLYERLKERFDAAEIVFSFEETDDLDLTVNFNETVFSTRLTEWRDAVREALA